MEDERNEKIKLTPHIILSHRPLHVHLLCRGEILRGHRSYVNIHVRIVCSGQSLFRNRRNSNFHL